MGAYLLTWNPVKFNWIDYTNEQMAVQKGDRLQTNWSCGVRKKLPIGSRIFMMRLGYKQPIHGIFASGYTTSNPFGEEHWNSQAISSKAQYVEIDLGVMLNPEKHKHLNPTKASDKFNWFPQSSGIRIPDDIAEKLETAWSEHLGKLNFDDVQANSSNARQLTLFSEPEVLKETLFVEGKSKLSLSKRYERDSKARQICIEFYGVRCQVCDMDFGERYGEIGEGFIHVHHLKPISEHDEEHTINPIHDLRPVCPNCHAMLHKRTPTYSIEELQYMLQDEI